jgi:hypothetical protein
MSDNVKTDLPTSSPNTLRLRRHPQKPMILSGKNIPEESVPTCESVVSASAKVISRFLHKSDKVDTDKSSLLRRRIQRRCAHSKS